jgi:hypothetical protein
MKKINDEKEQAATNEEEQVVSPGMTNWPLRPGELENICSSAGLARSPTATSSRRRSSPRLVIVVPVPIYNVQTGEYQTACGRFRVSRRRIGSLRSSAFLHCLPSFDSSLSPAFPIRDSPLPVCGGLLPLFPSFYSVSGHPTEQGSSSLYTASAKSLSVLFLPEALSPLRIVRIVWLQLFSCLSYLCYPSWAWPIFRPLHGHDSNGCWELITEACYPYSDCGFLSYDIFVFSMLIGGLYTCRHALFLSCSEAEGPVLSNHQILRQFQSFL